MPAITIPATTYADLPPLTANRALVSDGSGVITVSAATSTEAGYLSGVTSSIQAQLDGKQPLRSALTIHDEATFTVASAATVDLSTATSDTVVITGSTAISSFGNLAAGRKFFVRFSGSPTITHNATSLISPTGANISPTPGDTCILESLGSGNWRIREYAGSTVRTSALIVGGDAYVFSGIAETVFNEAGQSKNFRVETSGNTHALFVQSSTGRVGVNQSSPAYTFDVIGSVRATGGFNVTNNSTYSLANGVGYLGWPFSPNNYIVAQSASHVPLEVRGAGSQTGNLTEWRNSAGTIQALVSPAGGMVAGGASLAASAVLQADSTTRGFLPPRMTTTQRDAISSPAAGLVIFNTTTNKLNVYTTAWEAVTSA